MMIMTIWWSKATRLLEFSRSSANRTLWHEEEVGPGFSVTARGSLREEEDRGGIGYSSKWIQGRETLVVKTNSTRKLQIAR